MEMDQIKSYREIIESVFQKYAQLFNQQPEGVDVLAVFDENIDTYAIINVGWDGSERTNATTVLMRIIDDKIWVEADWTMYNFVDELLDAGVPQEDIVLAFHAPKMRQYTEFAVA